MNKLQAFISSKPMGFVTSADMPELIKLDRLVPMLVRCGGCRFTCAAQDVAHLIKCVAAGGDYVRDVSFPIGSMERAAKWVESCPVTPAAMLPESFVAPLQRPTVQAPNAWHLNRREDFNDADCGGVFDGNQVTSDADSGL